VRAYARPPTRWSGGAVCDNPPPAFSCTAHRATHTAHRAPRTAHRAPRTSATRSTHLPHSYTRTPL